MYKRQEIYNLSVSDLAVIVLCGFMAQMVSDTFAGMFCDKIGAKFSGIIAHVDVYKRQHDAFAGLVDGKYTSSILTVLDIYRE